MAETRVSAKTELAQADIASGDWLYMVDTSAGSSGGKKIDADAFVWTQKSSVILDDIINYYGSNTDFAIYYASGVNKCQVIARNGTLSLRQNAAVAAGNIEIDNDTAESMHTLEDVLNVIEQRVSS